MATTRPKTDHDSTPDLSRELSAVRHAARAIAASTDNARSNVLRSLARRARSAAPEILKANAQDLARMDSRDPKYDRLLLNAQRLESIARDLEHVAGLPTPVGEVLAERTLDNGLELTKLRVPLGVVAVIFESRPNVTFDVFALCLKSGNACVLKGSRDAADSNAIIVELIHQALEDGGLPTDGAYLAPPEREALGSILNAVGAIDVAIPRGSQGLIDHVRQHARIPVIETGAGIVHTYVDRSADLAKAERIVFNAKTRRVSVCNALDTLLVHRDLREALPALVSRMGESGVAIHSDEEALEILQGNYAGPLKPAREVDFGREYLAMAMSLKIVSHIDEALEHIARFSSRHSEAIVAEDQDAIEFFLRDVDAAAVYANASTAFTDGAQFAMGAEIGISTQKLHARGPMALPELTSYKWVVRGTGQIRD